MNFLLQPLGIEAGSEERRHQLVFVRSRIEYSFVCVRTSNLSPTIAGVAIENSSRLLMPSSSNSSPALITNVSPSSFKTKILPS